MNFTGKRVDDEYNKWRSLTIEQFAVIRRMIKINDAIILGITPKMEKTVIVKYRYPADKTEILRCIYEDGRWEYLDDGIKKE